jgi:hypothetical protein
MVSTFDLVADALTGRKRDETVGAAIVERHRQTRWGAVKNDRYIGYSPGDRLIADLR